MAGRKREIPALDFDSQAVKAAINSGDIVIAKFKTVIDPSTKEKAEGEYPKALFAGATILASMESQIVGAVNSLAKRQAEAAVKAANVPLSKTLKPVAEKMHAKLIAKGKASPGVEEILRKMLEDFGE